MNDPTPQRVALVTGAAVRLGRHVALGLAQAGYDVVATYHASAEPARTLRDEVGALGRRCEIVRADLSEPDAAPDVVGAVGEAFGRLDVLVNSAAGFDATPLLEVDAERWDAVMALNVRAPHLIVRAAVDLLRRAEGCVVNICDLAGLQPWTQHPAHAVSKAALVHLTRVQARVLAPEVRVNGIAPGAVLPPESYTDERLRALAHAAPLLRLGRPQDVVDAVLYLASAEFVTGQILVVDGGRTLGPPARGSDEVL
jgi:pteridine reductase